MQKQRHKPDTIRLAFKEWFVGGESNGEQRAFCPMCEDPARSKTPSASFNPDKGVWHCLKNDRHAGSTVQLAQWLKNDREWSLTSALMRAKNDDPSWTRRKEAGQAKAGKRTTPLPSEREITAWNSRLVKSPRILDKLKGVRGFDLDTINDYGIGWDGDRYTIPVYGQDGELVNVRKYKIDPGIKEGKMLGLGGHGVVIYGADELVDFNKVIITEGEMDCLLLRQYLREGDVGGYTVVSTTAGAGVFPVKFGPLFKDKEVWICYDADDEGVNGAKKVTSVLERFAKKVYTVKIPPHPKMKGTDVTDFLYKQGFSIEDLLALVKEATPNGEKEVEPLPTTGKKVTLRETRAAENQNEVIETEVALIGRSGDPYSGPKVVQATCDTSKGNVCLVCPLYADGGNATMEIRVDDPRVIDFVGASKPQRRSSLRELFGARCSDRVQFDEVEKHQIQMVAVQPSIDDRSDGESQAPMVRPLFALGNLVPDYNAKIRLVGRNVMDPRDGRLRLASWINDEVASDIDTFKLTSFIRSQLSVFQTVDDQSPLQKCREIAHDLAENVTQIYGRDIIHIAYDLAFHSVLAFRAGRKVVNKGWIEMMVIGDTRTGKSEIATRLIDHYQAGKLFSCEGASFAGIVGGNLMVDGQYFVAWGVVPTSDRRLVVLDEVTGMADKNIIEQMSSIRSHGVAQITKIADGETSARTRLIWISNPVDGSLRSEEDAGISALQDVVKLEEDQARFDYVVAARRNDVDIDVILDPTKRSVSPKYSSEACELLVKWAWSLTRNDVLISVSASRLSFLEAKRLGKEYIPTPPLIQAENVREKILRIACAIAARTFSCDEDGKLLVGREHVADAVRFLDMIYSDEAMNYKFKSYVTIQAQEKASKRKGVIKAWLLDKEEILNALRTLRGHKTFRPLRDFREIGLMEEYEAKLAADLLNREGMIFNKGKGDYAMTEALREVLKEIEMDKMA